MLHELVKRVEANADQAMRVRHDLHRIPEASNAEVKTAAYVAAELVAIGLTPREGVGGTGVVADLVCGAPGPVIALRADMDALPVVEETEASYQSQHPGFSHCCGHDGHVAVLLGLARVLWAMRKQLTGTIRFIFQPAEELGRGAMQMINDGVMGRGAGQEALAAVLGLHASPGIPVNTVATRPGVVTAAMDVFTVNVHGRGGHSARPELARNPLDGMAALMKELPRITAPGQVVCLCMATAGQRGNVIPEKGAVRGTCRCTSQERRELLREEIRRRSKEICAELGLTATISFDEGCPPVETDPALYDLFVEVTESLKEHGVRMAPLEGPSMGSEDFSFYLQEVPGLLFRIGMGLDSPDLHTPTFDFNDDGLATSMMVMGAMVLRLCPPAGNPMKPFKEHDYPTMGVEQEFHLIDPVTAELSPVSHQVQACLPAAWKEAACDELFHSVLEMRSAVCRTADELLAEVVALRQALGEACAKSGVRLVASATHPFSAWRDQRIIESDHYKWVIDQCGFLAQRLLSFGLHVHVAMRTADAAVYVQNEIRRWLYPLLALSANSPFYEGFDTGLASTRMHLFGSMPRTGLPPVVESFADLEDLFDKLIESGDVSAPGDLWWSIRPQPVLGTLELRVFDLPTSSRVLTALAALTQALVATYQDRFFDGIPRAELNIDYLEENRWKAMRWGLDTDIIDPLTGDVLSMRDQIGRLLDLVAPKLDELGSGSQRAVLADILENGTEADWQRAAAGRWKGDLRALELDLADRTLSG